MNQFLESKVKRIEQIRKLNSDRDTLSKFKSTGTGKDTLNILGMIKVIDRQIAYLSSHKEWLFNFEGGGWNSIWAMDKSTALKLAKEEYNDSDNLKVDKDSFRVSTPTDLKNLLSLFY